MVRGHHGRARRLGRQAGAATVVFDHELVAAFVAGILVAVVLGWLLPAQAAGR
jgi:F0F1-type ATP synthase assembly protein I